MNAGSKRRNARWIRGRRRWLPARADESGITTLEWLLIVAAVAGLAALAVVLVQNVVSDTSEQIAGTSARETAAKVAAQTVQAEARLPDDITKNSWNTWGKWERYFTAKCERIEITYSDAGIEMEALFARPTNEMPDDDTDQAHLNAADQKEAADTNKAQASCDIAS